jgi:hypothetical protein
MAEKGVTLWDMVSVLASVRRIYPLVGEGWLSPRVRNQALESISGNQD